MDWIVSLFNKKFHIFSVTFPKGENVINVTLPVSVKRRLRTADCGLRTADCGPGVKCRLCVKCRLQTESKRQGGVKCRPNINCSRGRVKGKKIPQIHVNEHLLDDICFHKSIPFFSGTSPTTRKHNRNLEPFFPPERPHASTLDAKFSIYVTRERELAPRWNHDVYA